MNIAIKYQPIFTDADVTFRVFEDDVNVHCNHANASEQLVISDRIEFDPIYGNDLPKDDCYKALICDKCGKESINGGEDWE